MQYKWVAEETWLFERIFEVDADLVAFSRAEWVFMGLDTMAEMFVNHHTQFAGRNAFG